MSEVLLFVHVFAATMFLGNIVVTAVWKLIADRSNNLNILRYAIKLVFLTDYVFTFGGAVLLSATGGYMARSYGMNFLDTPWLLYGVGCFLCRACPGCWGSFPIRSASEGFSTRHRISMRLPSRSAPWRSAGISGEPSPMFSRSAPCFSWSRGDVADF